MKNTNTQERKKKVIVVAGTLLILSAVLLAFSFAGKVYGADTEETLYKFEDKERNSTENLTKKDYIGSCEKILQD